MAQPRCGCQTAARRRRQVITKKVFGAVEKCAFFIGREKPDFVGWRRRESKVQGPKSRNGRIFGASGHYKKSFFGAAEKAVFEKLIKSLSLLTEMGVGRPKKRK